MKLFVFVSVIAVALASHQPNVEDVLEDFLRSYDRAEATVAYQLLARGSRADNDNDDENWVAQNFVDRDSEEELAAGRFSRKHVDAVFLQHTLSAFNPFTSQLKSGTDFDFGAYNYYDSEYCKGFYADHRINRKDSSRTKGECLNWCNESKWCPSTDCYNWPTPSACEYGKYRQSCSAFWGRNVFNSGRFDHTSARHGDSYYQCWIKKDGK